MQGNRYQFHPPHVWFVPQVLLEVEAIHVLVDEAKRASLSRIHPQERHYVHTPAVKETPYVNFLV